MSSNQINWSKLKITWILFLWMAWTCNGVYASPVQQPHSSNETIQAKLLNIPLSFERNDGQTDSKVKYLVRGQGCTMFFTPENLVMTLNQRSNQPSSVLKMKFVGANPNPQIKGLEEQEYKTNYLVKNDPKKWRSNISNYQKICYQEVYPGIDVVYYGNGRQLEYDICIAPNSNPNQARFQIEGAEKLFLDEKGNLRIVVADQNEIQMQRPFVYQVVDGKQLTVDSQFQLLASGEVGFKLGSYNPSHLLVIDPTLGYATYLGGTGNDIGNAITVDNAGNVYVTGSTNSLDFPTTPGVYQSATAGGTDIFITKIDPTGSSLIYSTYLGGTGSDTGNSIKIDSANNAYITGITTSSDFPTTPGAFQTTLPGTQSAFITKLDPLGQNLIYSTFLGATGNTTGYGIAIDSTDNAYVVGRTTSSTFPTTLGAFQTSLLGTRDGFITKLNSAGTALVYSTYLGGSLLDTVFGIAIDTAGSAYIAGETNSADFPTTLGAFQTSLQGLTDGFVAKLNPTGTNLDFSTYLGGSSFDSSTSIVIDGLGNSYVAGSTSSSNFPTTTLAYQTTLLGSSAAFITKLNPSGTALVYSTYLGGTGTGFQGALAIALDSSNNAYVSGQTESNDFPVTPDAFQSALGGTIDAFVTEINTTGTDLVYSTYLGGSSTDASTGIAIDINQNFYVVGYTSSTNFPVTSGAFQETYGGGSTDAFIAGFTASTPTTITLGVTPNPADFGEMVSLTATVSPSAATGTVSFFDGVTLLNTAPVVGGVAVFSTDTFTVGAHSLTAVYSGDGDYSGSTSAPVNLVVNLATTTTALGASPNPASLGQLVSLTATVSPSAATGTVSFFDGVTLLDTVPVASGVALFSTDTFTLGVHSLTAVYSGDGDFDGSTSAPVNLVVNSFLPSSTTLVVTPNPIDFGQAASLTATISPSGATGTVSFFDGVTLLSTVPVVGGVAVLSTDTFTVGVHSLTAVYSGDAGFNGSTSSPVNLVVNASGIATFTTLVATPNPAIAGQPVAFTVTVSPPIATGTVSLFSGSNFSGSNLSKSNLSKSNLLGSTLLGTAVVINGTATIIITAPTRAGIFPVIAIYSGDANFSGSSSVLTFLTVEQSSVFVVLPPRHLRGLQTENRFATQSDIINVLKWRAPSSGNQPIAYRIYRGSLDHLVAVVNANQSLVYEDHNRRKGKKYLYYVISEDEFGNFSEPKSVIIR